MKKDDSFEFDIEERKRWALLEQENKKLKQKLKEAEQMLVSKENFISQISHEIRTPLNVVIGMASIAREEIKMQDKVLNCLTDIEDSSRELLSILNDIIDVSALSSGQLAIDCVKFDLKDQMTNLAILFYEQAKQKNIHFDIHVRGVSDEVVIGDEKRLNQVLMNLLSNSIRFTPPGGKVDFSVVQASTSRDRVHMRFVIRDTGRGFSQEVLDQIFDPFANTTDIVEHIHSESGIGLSIAYALVRLMNGSVIAQSHQGEETCLTIDIPFKKCAQITQENLTDKMIACRTLIVSDDEEIRQDRGEMLQDMGIPYDLAISAEDALDKIGVEEEAKNPFRLCMIDWNLMSMPAEELIQHIRDIFGEQMVIIVTAYHSAQVVEKGISAGANYVIENTLFRSTMFDALMKIEKGEIVRQETENSISKEYDFSTRRILLVEDVALNMEVAVKLLSKAGATVICAENGLEAVTTYLQNPSGFFDCIFMDINMPVMDGYEAAKMIRAGNKGDSLKVPIFAMTANAFTQDIAQALDCGMTGHIAKPIDIQVLYETLQGIFDGEKNTSFENTIREKTLLIEKENENRFYEVQHDELTGLLNKTTFEKESYRLMCIHQPMALILFKVNYLSQIRMAYGDETGDEILKRFAGLLRQNFNETQYHIRLEEDEFVVVLDEFYGNEQYLTDKVEYINREMAQEKDNLPVTNVYAYAVISDYGYTVSLYEQACIGLQKQIVERKNTITIEHA